MSFVFSFNANHLTEFAPLIGQFYFQVYFPLFPLCCRCLLRTNVRTYIFMTTMRAVNNIFVNVNVHTV